MTDTTSRSSVGRIGYSENLRVLDVPAATEDWEARALAAEAVLRKVVAQLHPRADFHRIGFGVGGLEEELRAVLVRAAEEAVDRPPPGA